MKTCTLDPSTRCIAVAVLLMAAIATVAQEPNTLIGPSLRNGSFEDGVVAPWGGVQVINDPFFASDGIWNAVLQDNANGQTARAVCFQHLEATPDSGHTLILRFDARNGVIGFDTISDFINAWNEDGTPMSVIRTPVSSSPIGNSGWIRHETMFQLPEIWDGGGDFLVGIQFTKLESSIGTVYTGYLDNVILTQIPEPSAAVLLLCGSLLLAGFARRRHVIHRQEER